MKSASADLTSDLVAEWGWRRNVVHGSGRKETVTEQFRKRYYRSFADVRRDLGPLLRQRGRIRALRDGVVISRDFQERLMLAVTEVNGCRYCAFAHSKMALAAGLTASDIAALATGDVSGAPDEEIPALLYAQHWAECDARPDPAVRQSIVDRYGQEKTEAIELALRMIRMGNLSGNTGDYLLHRLSGGRWGGR